MRGLCCLVGIGRHCSSDIGLKYPLIDHLSLTLAFDLEWKIPWSLRGHLVNADPPINGSECSPGVIRIWFIFVRQAADGSKNSTQAVAACWAATAWFSGLICTWQLHAASPLMSATYISKHTGANQIATRLLRHCSGPARCCSQPASRLM